MHHDVKSGFFFPVGVCQVRKLCVYPKALSFDVYLLYLQVPCWQALLIMWISMVTCEFCHKYLSPVQDINFKNHLCISFSFYSFIYLISPQIMEQSQFQIYRKLPRSTRSQTEWGRQQNTIDEINLGKKLSPRQEKVCHSVVKVDDHKVAGSWKFLS